MKTHACWFAPQHVLIFSLCKLLFPVNIFVFWESICHIPVTLQTDVLQSKVRQVLCLGRGANPVLSQDVYIFSMHWKFPHKFNRLCFPCMFIFVFLFTIWADFTEQTFMFLSTKMKISWGTRSTELCVGSERLVDNI